MDKLKIHIVENEIIIAYDLQDMLEELGYIVNDISMSVEEVYEKLEKDDSSLFILDINLKGDKTSFELENTLLLRQKHIIYMSSTTDREAIKKAREQIFVEKPFDLKDINEAIEVILKNNR